MNLMLGNFSLSLAVLVAMAAVMTSLAAAKFNSAALITAGKWIIAIFFGLLTLSSASLMLALVNSDFRLEYVVHYTERALPFGYKLAAFWAGQEGSLLLWAWLLAGMSVIAVFTFRSIHEDESKTEPAAVIGTLGVACTFFAALMLFAANPFKVAEFTKPDGNGLNPMLQDPGMIAHPPLLFLGYAGFTIPFALLVGAMIARRKDNEWILATRKWALVSWLFLSIGILLGAQWAYVELGWGGYWAWDPVENASLLPWLTGTALLHSIMVQQHRGMFKKWNAALIAITFILCIFGTYITRSGIIDSVHSFGKSLVGTFFLVFLLANILFSIGLLAFSQKILKPEHELDGLIGKEGFFLATNVLLLGMTIITLIGTIFPVISSIVAGQQVTVNPNFYNKVVAPLGLVLAALMAVGPLLVYGKDAANRLIKEGLVPALFALVTVVFFIVTGLHNIWALIAAAVAAATFASVGLDLIRSTLARAKAHGENIATALAQLVDSNHRRYGGQIVHIGTILIIVGITGSSLFNQKETFSMKPGESVQFAGRTLTLAAVKPASGVNYEAVQAVLTFSNPGKDDLLLTPQIRQYNKWEEQANSEVSIRSTWREDVYVTLAAYDEHGSVTIQAIINPLVSWIWAGGIILTLGGIVSLLPRVLPHAAPVAAVAAPEIRNPKHEIPNKGKGSKKAKVPAGSALV
jgi:cytochrome c-type biogenesis protein CcmF